MSWQKGKTRLDLLFAGYSEGLFLLERCELIHDQQTRVKVQVTHN